MKIKIFDCVDMKRRGSEKIYEYTKDMTMEEELIYWQKRTEELKKLQQKRKLTQK